MPEKTAKTKTIAVTLDGAMILEETRKQYQALRESFEATRGPTKAEFYTTVGDITERLTRMETGLSLIGKDVSVLKTDVAVLKTDVAVLKTDVADLKSGQARIEAQQADLVTIVERHDLEIIGLRAAADSPTGRARPPRAR